MAIAEAVAVGQELPPLAKELSQRRIDVYSGVRLLGAGFVRGGTLSMAFIKPVYAGDRLTVHGVVKETRPEGAGTRVVVEVWCQNQHGEKTAVGTASGLRP